MPPPPDVGPRQDSVVGPAPAKPPVVTAPDPAALVATPDRTVVTRRPRASHKPSEPHELMPTLRMPPVEARALRRQVSGAPEGEPDPVSIGSGDIEIDTDEPEVETPPLAENADAAPPAVEAPARQPALPSQATVRVATIPTEDTSVGATPKSPTKLHRPPLPLPDVLRNGPRPLPRTDRAPRPIAEASSASTAVPDAIPVIDTASLVLEMAESLAAVPVPEPEPAAETETPIVTDSAHAEPDVVVVPLPPSPRLEPTRVPVATIDDAPQAEPRRRGVLALAIGVAASIAAAVWWLVPPAGDVAQVDTAFAPLGDQLAFVASSTPEPQPVAEVTPPAPTPALAASSDAAPAAALLGAKAGDLIADAVMPTTDAVPEPEPAAEDAVIEVDDAPVAAPAPAAAPAPKTKATPKSKAKAKSKSKPKPQPTKVAAAAPPPPPKTAPLDPAALLRDAEKAYAEGRYGTALRSAQRSLALRNDARATRIIALSACKLKRESTAKSAFDKLPLGQRRSVKNACKDVGIKL